MSMLAAIGRVTKEHNACYNHATALALKNFYPFSFLTEFFIGKVLLLVIFSPFVNSHDKSLKD